MVPAKLPSARLDGGGILPGDLAILGAINYEEKARHCHCQWLSNGLKEDWMGMIKADWRKLLGAA